VHGQLREARFHLHAFISVLVACESEDEIRRLGDAPSERGKTFMPLDEYGFSRRFAGISDRFGVAWQLNVSWARTW